MKAQSYKRFLEDRYAREFGAVNICSSVPADWLPRVRDMLAEARRVTPPARRRFLEFSDIKEKRGRLDVTLQGADDNTEAALEHFEEIA